MPIEGAIAFTNASMIEKQKIAEIIIKIALDVEFGAVICPK